MANYLKYIEFIGLPGSGKSYYSHLAAERLREEGYHIKEPSWELDHLHKKYSRALRKVTMAFCYSVKNREKTKRINELIEKCGYSGREYRRFKRNILYKIYYLNIHKNCIVIFDEGFCQVAVSMSMSQRMPSDIIFKTLSEILDIGTQCIIINIECSIDEALRNMGCRNSHDSKAEKIYNHNSRKAFLSNYKDGCNSISSSIKVAFSRNAKQVVSIITDFIKDNINIQKQNH